MGSILGVTLEFSLEAAPRLETVSGRAREVLGFDAEELVAGQVSFLARIHPADADVVARLFSPEPGEAGGTVCLRVRHRDGRVRCLQTGFSKLNGTASGPGEATHGVIRLELTLASAGDVWSSPAHEQLPHFDSMIENTEEPVFFKDVNHVFVAASRAFGPEVVKVLGDRPLLGLTDYDFLPEHDADQYFAAEKRALTEGVEVEEVLQVARPEEGLFLMYVHHRPVRSAAGDVIGIFTTARNLTARVRQEEAPDEVVRKAEVGTYVIDMRRGAAATSATLDTILGMDENYPRDMGGWQRLLHPEDVAGTLENLGSVVDTPGRMFNREYRIVRPLDGAVRWIHGIGRTYRDAGGNPLVMRGTLEDITERKAMESELRQANKRLELFIEHAPAALAMYDNEMRYLAVSRRWRQVYSVSAEDLMGRCHYDVVPDLPERWKELHRRSLAGESLSCAEDQFDRSDGSTIWVRWEMMPWRYDDETIGGLLLFVEDITDRKRAQQRLELAASVFADASEAIFVTDVNGMILEVNDAFTRTTGFTRKDVLGQHSHVLKSDRHDGAFYEGLGRAVSETGRWRGEQWFRRKDGSSFEVSATITTVYDGSGKPAQYVALFFDITPMREQERKLVQVTHYDDLTGLPNRAFTSERLRSAIVAAGQTHHKVGLVFFDLDNFRSINEAHGREAADLVLVAVSARMKQVLGEGDTLGRIGGDEFLIVLPDLPDIEPASERIERLLKAFDQPVAVGAIEVQLSATAGATFYPQAEEVDADQMIRQAVQAMYEAKLAGKNRSHLFDPARDYNLRGRHEEIGRIRQALRADELVLHYQPKVDMATGSLIGAEALIRWQHPQRGLLLPDRFLPSTEDDDLAIEVGEWVIEAALQQVQRWAAAGHRIPVSVNMSARHLQQANFVERLREILLRYPGVDPTCLELEILETSTVQDFDHVKRIIEACLAIGIQVSIDDFGMGYSSLTYLKRLPAPVLKIDRSFVSNMLEDADDLALLQGVMGLANAFRRTVVAEGVETVEQGILLLRLGCAYAQGYGIARPMPADEIITWYSNWWPDARWTHASLISNQDWPLLVAQVEVRAWGRALERYMQGMQAVPPELDERRCRFGSWLEAEKSGPRAGSPTLLQVEALHRRAHVAARKAVKLKQQDQMEDAMSLVRSAAGLHEEIHARLDSFAGSCEAKAERLHRTRARSRLAPMYH